MDGSAFEGIGSFIIMLMVVSAVGILGTLGFGGYTLYNTLLKKEEVIESKTPPVISWRLQAEGQRVDTIWIYKFKQ